MSATAARSEFSSASAAAEPVPGGEESVVFLQLARFFDDAHQRGREGVPLGSDLRNPGIVHGDRVVERLLGGVDTVELRAQLRTRALVIQRSVSPLCAVRARGPKIVEVRHLTLEQGAQDAP